MNPKQSQKKKKKKLSPHIFYLLTLLSVSDAHTLTLGHVPTSQLRPVKPWLHVQAYSQVSSGLPADGSARQNPPFRQGLPSQGSGRGVAWVGVGSAGAGVSGASWKGEGTAPMLLPLPLPLHTSSSSRTRGGGCVKLRAVCAGRRRGSAGTLHTLILILILSLWTLLCSAVRHYVGVFLLLSSELKLLLLVLLVVPAVLSGN